MIRLAIVSPCYNEEEALPSSAQQLTKMLIDLIDKRKISPDSYIMFVNDGSADKTWDVIKELNLTNSYVCGLNLVFNVGSEAALFAGMMNVKDECDVAITIDADLQDDLNAVEEMIDKYYNEHLDVVYGVKTSRKADSFFKRHTAQTFYKMQRYMGAKIIYNHTNFRLMSKNALDGLAQFSERSLYLRGLVPMLGLPSGQVEEVIKERVAGQSKYNISALMRVAVDGITSLTIRPMYFILGIGAMGVVMSFLMFIYSMISYFAHWAVRGWTSIVISIWFLGSMILFSLGVIGIYVGKTYLEVKGRPRYYVAEKLTKKS
ncbi:glycosyltransferase family 2 protein [Porphyromonas pogonae]|uniref:glycosyltransferase family 2 protein n=1 Tax=Porphyromonas pogonae TaxID=867595 RepID=UPI002E76D5BD|nr:glycosyltransferase family 2 protein [Porphyromonas pogonae]